jgi:hypothetical protein
MFQFSSALCSVESVNDRLACSPRHLSHGAVFAPQGRPQLSWERDEAGVEGSLVNESDQIWPGASDGKTYHALAV